MQQCTKCKQIKNLEDFYKCHRILHWIKCREDN